MACFMYIIAKTVHECGGGDDDNHHDDNNNNNNKYIGLKICRI